MSCATTKGYIKQECMELVHIVFGHLVGGKPCCVVEVYRKPLLVAVISLVGQCSPL